jgi:hypothetical protein
VLSKYSFADDKKEPEPERRRVDFGHDDDGWWRCWGTLGAEEGAKVQRAMEFERERHKLESWADALVAVAERALAADHATRGHHDAQTVIIHLHPDGTGNLHLGPGQDGGARPPRGGGQRGTGPAAGARAHPHGRRGARPGLSGPGL